jgi:hypothetical protein
MAHNLKGSSYYCNKISSGIDVFNECKYFMENIVGFPWVVEKVNDTEFIYYLDDTKTIGFKVLYDGSDFGIYVLSRTTKSKKSIIAPIAYYGPYYWLYSHVSAGENAIYIGSLCYYSSNKKINGIVAAKDDNDKWSILYSSDSCGYIADENDIDVATKIAFNKIYDGINSYYSFVKCPNILSGKEYKELYLATSCPARPIYNDNDGLQELYASADGKTYRLVPLYGDYIQLAFPVSD